MNLVTRKKIVVLLMFSAGTFFFFDAMLFGLYPSDPVLGRRMGCYTFIELWLGLKSPTTWIRDAELYGSLALFMIGAVSAFLGWRSEKKQRKAS